LADNKVIYSMSRFGKRMEQLEAYDRGNSGIAICRFGNKARRVDGYPLTSSSADPLLHQSAQFGALVFYPTLVDSARFQAQLILNRSLASHIVCCLNF
jgi:hypothetical protein